MDDADVQSIYKIWKRKYLILSDGSNKFPLDELLKWIETRLKDVPSDVLLSIWSALVMDYPQIATYEKVHLKLNQFWMESIKREDPYMISFDTNFKKLPTNLKLILEMIREKEQKKSKEAAIKTIIKNIKK